MKDTKPQGDTPLATTIHFAAEGVKVLSKTPISQAKGQGGITVKAVNSFQLKEMDFSRPCIYQIQGRLLIFVNG